MQWFWYCYRITWCLSWRAPITSCLHDGGVTHICISKLTIIGWDNGLSPERRQAIFCTNDGILLIGPVGTAFGEILIEMYIFSFKKMHLKTSSAKWRTFCIVLNESNTAMTMEIMHHGSPSLGPAVSTVYKLTTLICIGLYYGLQKCIFDLMPLSCGNKH